MPGTYSGPLRLTDTAGERHTIAATHEAVDDGEWLGNLSALLDSARVRSRILRKRPR